MNLDEIEWVFICCMIMFVNDVVCDRDSVEIVS